MLFISARTRLWSTIAAATIGAWLFWDNVISETRLDSSGIELRNIEMSVPDHGLPSVAVQIRFNVANRGDLYLESVDVELVVEDCIARSICKPVGRKVERVQSLVEPGGAKHAEAWVYFENIAAARGHLKARVRVVGGIGDRF